MIIKPFTQICPAVYPNGVKCGKVIFFLNKLNFNRATTKILFSFKKTKHFCDNLHSYLLYLVLFLLQLRDHLGLQRK